MPKHGYLCNKSGLTFGRKTLHPGMPVPPSEVTRLLLKLEWVRVATLEEYADAVAEYGEPPEKLEQPGDWEYRKKGAAAPAGEKAARKRGSRKQADPTAAEKPKRSRKKGAAAPAGE